VPLCLKVEDLFLSNTIPEETISEIKHTADIVDVISDRVVLKKTGRNYLGLCPFHSEKTPSFTVSSEKQMFYCFGCGEGGNIFTFIMKQEGIAFPEAVRFLANRYGIEIAARSSRVNSTKIMDERESLFQINRQAMAFFHNTLTKTVTGKSAAEYLVQRGISSKIIEDFKLGYSQSGWNQLTNYFLEKGVTLNLVERAGLICRRSNGNGYYDRFRDRIIFPIFDLHHQVVGFGGRVMDDSLPKYLNSPETPIYHKSRSLYGLSHANRFAGSQMKCSLLKAIWICCHFIFRVSRILLLRWAQQ